MEKQITPESLKEIVWKMHERMSVSGTMLMHWLNNVAVFAPGTRIECDATMEGSRVRLSVQIFDHLGNAIISETKLSEVADLRGRKKPPMYWVEVDAIDLCTMAMCTLLQGGVAYWSDVAVKHKRP